ncbi:MAG: cation:proton antiporter [Sandaracinaceae bacterium]
MRASPRLWLLATGAALLGAVGLPSVARASGGGGDGSETLVVVALIATVAVAYLFTNFVLERIQRRVLMLVGVEYIVLGVVLGPNMPYEIPAFSNLDDLLPIVALAVGWVGLLRGMELSLKRFRSNAATGSVRIVVVQALVAGGATTAAAYAMFTSGQLFVFGSHATEAIVGPREVWMAAGVMGCAAAAGSFEPVELLKRRYRLEGDLSEKIRRMAAMSDLLAVLVFGLLFCIFHESNEDALVQPSPTEWAVVSVGLGALLGVLFTPFLGQDDSENGRFLAMIGIIVLASGAAYFLDLSPLLVNLCLGVVLVNTARSGKEIQETLRSTRKPMALVLLVFAGALWHPPDLVPAVLISAGYVLLRFLGKALGTKLATLRTGQRGDTYRGLLAHGEVSVAMAVSLRLVSEGPAVDLAYTAILVSVIVNDLIAPRVLRGLLVDTGDLRGEREPEAA